MKNTCLVLLFSLVLLPIAWGSDRPLIDTDQLTNMVNLIEATNSLAVDIYQKLAAGSRGNIFISPFSLANALGLLFYGARGDTAQEMADSLYYDEYNLTQRGVSLAFYNLIKVFLVSHDPSMYVFESASTLMVDRRFEISPEFKQQAEVFYQAPISVSDFASEGDEAVCAVNGWVREKTRGRIGGIVDEIDPSSDLVLLNAVFFKAAWWYTFREHLNTEETFYNAPPLEPKQVTMMHQVYEFPYSRDANRSLVELPFKGRNLSMVFLLPGCDGLGEFEQGLTLQGLREDLAALEPSRVEVVLPRFAFDFEADLSAHLASLGLQGLFEPGRADLGGVTDGDQCPAVGGVRHRTALSVAESGVEASAVTAAVTLKSLDRDGDAPVFRADRPFLFFVLDRRTDLVLFLGRVDSL